MTLKINQEIEDFKRKMLNERIIQLTEPQLALFNRLFPDKIPEEKLITAIDLCDRTIRKNLAGRD